jgi:mannose-6-phosphate isomerase-like protein (cupin superfamily)
MNQPDQPGSGAPSLIHDVVVSQLHPEDGRILALRRDDHLLRRFGAAEILRLNPGQTFGSLRKTADEIWAVLEGEADVRLEDQRPDSPTIGTSDSFRAVPDTRILVPFGVRAELRPVGSSLVLLRLMTHDATEDPPA